MDTKIRPNKNQLRNKEHDTMIIIRTRDIKQLRKDHEYEKKRAAALQDDINITEETLEFLQYELSELLESIAAKKSLLMKLEPNELPIRSRKIHRPKQEVTLNIFSAGDVLCQK